jgi:hypothetical protein
MSGRPLIDNESDIILILEQAHYRGCEYGRPDGPDGFINTCDCGMTKEIADEYYAKRHTYRRLQRSFKSNAQVIRNVEVKMKYLKSSYLIFSEAARYANLTESALKRLEKEGTLSVLILKKNGFRYYSIKELDMTKKNSTERGCNNLVKFITKK